MCVREHSGENTCIKFSTAVWGHRFLAPRMFAVLNYFKAAVPFESCMDEFSIRAGEKYKTTGKKNEWKSQTCGGTLLLIMKDRSNLVQKSIRFCLSVCLPLSVSFSSQSQGRLIIIHFLITSRESKLKEASVNTKVVNLVSLKVHLLCLS